MDIQILRDGKETGPYTEEAVQALLKEGSVLINDLAWRPGLPDWVPLMYVLYPAATRPPAPPVAPKPEEPAPAPAPREPASARQKAFLDYVGIAFPPDVTKEDASSLVNDAMENPKDPARLARWNEERLHLHPELFTTEITARKEGRSQRFLEICHEEGASFFEKVTKAHCQVLVAHLDVHSPNWDANERDAATKHFFPALAEKFPQLLTEEGKGKFKAAKQPQAAARHAKSSPVAVKTPPPSKSRAGKVVYAVARGIFVGLIILGLLWVGRGFFVNKPAPKKTSVPTADASPTAPAADEAATSTAPAPAPPVVAPQKETAQAAAPEKPVEAPVATAPAPSPATPEPAMAAAEMKPPETIPVLPGTGESLIPSATPSLIPSSPALPAAGDSLMPAATPGLIPPAGAARTSVILTKAIEITLPFGKISVPPGTAVKIVSQNGSALTVRYLDHVVTIPASSTDLGADPAARTTTTPP